MEGTGKPVPPFLEGRNMATINFFYVDPETFEDVPAGSVTIQDGKFESDNPDLLDLAQSIAPTPQTIIRALTDWSNGYLRSELATGSEFGSTGTIALTSEESNG